MKHQLLKFHCGNKAIVFTLDIIAAATVFAIAFVVSVYYTSQASENKLAQIQTTTAASDLLSLLDNTGTLQTLNPDLIENKTSSLLAQSYQMRILIRTKNNATVDIGGVAPEGKLVVTGSRYFVANDDFGQARYWIWARE